MLKKIMRMTCLLLVGMLLAGCSQGTTPGGSDGTVEPELSVLSAKILSGRGCIHLEWSIKNSTKETWKVEDKITVLYKDDKGEWVEGGVSRPYSMADAMLEPKQTRSQTDVVTGMFAKGVEYRIQKYLEKKDTGEGIFLQAAFTAEEVTETYVSQEDAELLRAVRIKVIAAAGEEHEIYMRPETMLKEDLEKVLKILKEEGKAALAKQMIEETYGEFDPERFDEEALEYRLK